MTYKVTIERVETHEEKRMVSVQRFTDEIQKVRREDWKRTPSGQQSDWRDEPAQFDRVEEVGERERTVKVFEQTIEELDLTAVIMAVNGMVDVKEEKK